MSESRAQSPSRKAVIKSSGMRYRNVWQMIEGQGLPGHTADAVEQLASTSRVADLLATLRVRAGVTQEDLATELNWSPQAVSALECGPDDAITLGQLRAYADALGGRFRLTFGPRMGHLEEIRAHALAMRHEMLELIGAETDEHAKSLVDAFFGQAFFGLLSILAACRDFQPKRDETGVRIDWSCGGR